MLIRWQWWRQHSDVPEDPNYVCIYQRYLEMWDD